MRAGRRKILREDIGVGDQRKVKGPTLKKPRVGHPRPSQVLGSDHASLSYDPVSLQNATTACSTPDF